MYDNKQKQKKPMKRVGKLRLMPLLLGVALLTSACSSTATTTPSQMETGSTPAQSASQPETSGGDKVIVEYWYSLSGKNEELIQTFVKNFNDAHDDIEVVATFQGTYHETIGKLQQAIPSGTAPDVVMVERGRVEYLAASGTLLDLTDYVAAAGMQDFFNPGLMGHSYYEDQLVSLPFNRSTPILHVNKTVLDEIGMDIPNTWEELREAAQKAVVKEGNETARYGLTMPYDTWYHLALTNQAGGKLLSDDGKSIACIEDGTLEKATTFIKDMERDGALIYPPVGYGGDYCNQLFIGGQVAFMFSSTGSIGSLIDLVDFEYTTAFLPMDKVRSTPTGGANVCVLATSKHPDAAWEFIEWEMKNEKGALEFIVSSGYLPFSDTYVQSKAIQTLWAEHPLYRTAYEQLQYAQDTNKTVHWPELEAAMLVNLEAIMYDDADIHQEIEKFGEEANRILNQ